MNSFTHLVRSEPGEESRGGVGSVEWVIRGTWREDDVCWDYNWHWDNCDDYKNCSDWEGALKPTHDLATNARSTAVPPPPPHTNHKYEEIPGLTKKLYTCQSQHSTVLVAFRLFWTRTGFVIEPAILRCWCFGLCCWYWESVDWRCLLV